MAQITHKEEAEWRTEPISLIPKLTLPYSVYHDGTVVEKSQYRYSAWIPKDSASKNPGREHELSMGFLDQASISAIASLLGRDKSSLILRVTCFVLYSEQVDFISSLGPSNSESSLVNDSLWPTYRNPHSEFGG